ncbi:MAG: hypothetical protein O7C75_03550 [Verrucomicrobia bacterium]|nr:hypothetical protein [Verrucomicrobiota bacterium]
MASAIIVALFIPLVEESGSAPPEAKQKEKRQTNLSFNASDAVPHMGRPMFLFKLAKSETLGHGYQALRKAFPTIDSLDGSNRSEKPQPLDKRPVPLQTFRMLSNDEDLNRIVFGTDEQGATNGWVKLFEASGDLPERFGSMAGMPETVWILDTENYITLEDVKVKGFKVRVTLKDYKFRDSATNTDTVISGVLHVLAKNLDQKNPGELIFLLPEGPKRVFVLSEEEGVFVFSGQALEGSPLYQIIGWKEKTAPIT